MSKHLKRLAVPRSWTIQRKTNVYTAKPTPGPHPIERAVPLGTVLRDYLGVAATGREARNAVSRGDVLVDGRLVKEARLPVGFMDVISVPKLKRAWRAVIDARARLVFVEVTEKDAAWKLSQVTGKSTLKGGKTQINLHDGRNLLVKKDDYSTGDVLKLEMPSQKILGHFRLEEGQTVLVVGGQHAGEVAPVQTVETTRSHKANLVKLSAGGDASFTTIKPYAFPIGDKDALPKVEVKTVA